MKSAHVALNLQTNFRLRGHWSNSRGQHLAANALYMDLPYINEQPHQLETCHWPAYTWCRRAKLVMLSGVCRRIDVSMTSQRQLAIAADRQTE